MELDLRSPSSAKLVPSIGSERGRHDRSQFLDPHTLDPRISALTKSPARPQSSGRPFSGSRFSQAERDAMSRRIIPRRYNQDKVDTALERQGRDMQDTSKHRRSSSMPALRKGTPVQHGALQISTPSRSRRPSVTSTASFGDATRHFEAANADVGTATTTTSKGSRHRMAQTGMALIRESSAPASPRRSSPRSAEHVSMRSSSVTALNRERVRENVERLLPVRDRMSKQSSQLVSTPPTSGQNTTSHLPQEGAGEMRRSSATAMYNQRKLAHGNSTVGFPTPALRQLRSRILQEHRSLCDALAVLEKDYNIDRGMIKPELHVALRRASAEGADEFFVRVEEVYPAENISLSTLFKELVTSVTPEGPLWELRIRLENFGLWPHTISEALEILRRFLKSKMGFKVVVADNRPIDEDNLRSSNAPSSPKKHRHKADEFMLSYCDWLRFCGILGLHVFEAKLLFGMLKDDSKPPLINLGFMFELVQGTVAPNASLMTCAERATIKHGSLREAFQAICWNLDRQMTLSHFQTLAHGLGFGARATEKMWTVLVLGETSTQQETSTSRIGEDEFVAKLLRWTPNVAFDALKAQLCEQYGNLSEGKRALRRHGLPGGAALTPRKFKRVLRAAGIMNSDTDAIVSKVMDARTRDTSGLEHEVTLDEVFDRLRGVLPTPTLISGADSSEAVVAAETAPVWKQLRSVERELERGSELISDSLLRSNETLNEALSLQAEQDSVVEAPKWSAPTENAAESAPKQLSVDSNDNSSSSVLMLPGEQEAVRFKAELVARGGID